jgi:catechol 2,3-dioxygenase-like lactoylglutathione lyase family enzyme
MEINQVTVACRNYEASVSFYRKLGLTQIVDSPPRYARFETPGGSTLSIHEGEEGCPSTVIYFEVDDVDAVVDRLKERGLEFDSEPVDQQWLWREAHLRDPAGNRLCIYHAGENRRYPPWRLPDEDR